MAVRRGVDEVLEGAVERGDVPLVVAMAADEDGVIYEGAFGERTPGSGGAVTPDTTFRIASMTKMVATVAALQQVERGNLDLDDTVETYLPEFGELMVLEGFDGDTPRMRPPATKATVRQLVTHTTGLSYWFWNADIVRWEEASGTPNVMSGSMEIFKAPMVADPGALGVRHQRRLAGPRGRGGQRPRPARVPRRPHPRPARHDLDALPHRRGAAR